MYRNELAGFLGFAGNRIVLNASSGKYRGKGLGKYLWSAACGELFSHGYGEIVSSISASNMPALNLYASLGFRFRNPLDVYHRLNV
jgi:ribosomal protein S18 acetylase RimI-like enzyme